ncbi:MAG: Mth938-like domain-containing protein [Burkholderiales bacterium]|nr:MAG: Mth938-like domain-containing protein [Burkholderiales bacterium]
MKLQFEQAALNTVTAYGDDYVEVNRVRYHHALLLAPEGPVERWPAEGEAGFAAQSLRALLERAPEIVLLGTGARQRFPHPSVTAPLLSARVGVEVMDTQAACRTYNILMSEGRRVLAVLLL